MIYSKFRIVSFEQLLSYDLNGYCKEDKYEFTFSLPGVVDDNIHHQPYCTPIAIPCEGSKIYFCDSYFLQNVLLGSKNWYIASRVKRNQST